MVVCQTSLFSIETSIILGGVQSIVMLCLVATLCKGGNTKDGGYVE
jgi:hypothetical protein